MDFSRESKTEKIFIKQNLHVSGPTLIKLVFKGQLYYLDTCISCFLKRTFSLLNDNASQLIKTLVHYSVDVIVFNGIITVCQLHCIFNI